MRLTKLLAFSAGQSKRLRSSGGPDQYFGTIVSAQADHGERRMKKIRNRFMTARPFRILQRPTRGPRLQPAHQTEEQRLLLRRHPWWTRVSEALWSACS